MAEIMNEKQLIAEAKLKYPIGTKYIPAHVKVGINEVTGTNFSYDKPYIHVQSKHIKDSYNICIYDEKSPNKWAKIIEIPKPLETICEIW
jgi:hypothetical protein